VSKKNKISSAKPIPQIFNLQFSIFILYPRNQRNQRLNKSKFRRSRFHKSSIFNFQFSFFIRVSGFFVPLRFCAFFTKTRKNNNISCKFVFIRGYFLFNSNKNFVKFNKILQEFVVFV